MDKIIGTPGILLYCKTLALNFSLILVKFLLFPYYQSCAQLDFAVSAVLTTYCAATVLDGGYGRL